MEALRGLSAQLVTLRKGNPQSSDAELGEVVKNVIQKLVTSGRRARESQRQFGSPDKPASLGFASLSRAGRPDRTSLDHLPAGCCGEPVQSWSSCAITCAGSGLSCAR
jgi:hypothetical protein